MAQHRALNDAHAGETSWTRITRDARLASIPTLERAPVQQFRRGAFLIEVDTPADTVHVVRTGQVRVFRLKESGDETTTAVLGPGQVVGLAVLLGYPTHPWFAQALVPTTVWSIPAAEVFAQLPRDPQFLSLIVEALGRRLSLSQSLLRNVSLLPVAERVPDALARIETCLGGEPPRLTRELLAGLVAARPETVSRVIGPGRAA